MTTNNPSNTGYLASATEVQIGTDTRKLVTPSTLNSLMSDSTQSGFVSWGGAGAYFDDTTLGSFTVLRQGTGYIKGKLVSWTGPQTVAGMTAGNSYWIYIDSTGTIGKASVFATSIFTDNIVLFECLRDSTPVTNNQVTVKENHPYNYQTMVSLYNHNVIGCIIENTQNGANITLNGTQKIQINGADSLNDHGLNTTIPDSAAAAVTFYKYYTLAGGKWARYISTDTFTGHYNNAGTPTALTAGRFAIYTLYASKDSLNSATPFYFAVLDTAQYTSTASANTAISNGTTAKATNELANLEIVQLGYIIYRESTAAIVQVTISKSTLKQTLSTGGTNTAALVNTNVTNFNGWLSAADTNVQAALETLDNILGKDGVQVTTAVGNTTGTTAFNINTGTGGSTITTTNGIFTVATGTGSIGIGTDAVAKTTTIGNTTGASVLALKTGTGDFTLASATGTIMSALDTGEINKPLQPAFSAQASQQNDKTGDSTTYTLVFATEIFDQNADFDATSTFTAPVTGRYQLGTTIGMLALASANSCENHINTSNRTYYIDISKPNFEGGGTCYVNYSVFADMDAGDTAAVTCQVLGGGKIIDIGNQSFFWGHLVC